ncbi:MAG TPA: EAL domain-containing protein [Rhizobacter sp.]
MIQGTRKTSPPAIAAPQVLGLPRQRLASRLTRAAVVAAGLALVSAGVALNVFLYFSARSAIVDDMLVQARAVADNSAAAVLFDDQPATRDTLATLAALRSVTSAYLFDVHGELIAFYRPTFTDGMVDAPLSAHVAATTSGARISGGHIYITQPVQHQGRSLGRLAVSVSMRPLQQRTLAFAGVTALCTLGALALAYLFALGLRRDINRTEARLDELAYVDAVTGLYNRNAAGEHLRELVARRRPFGVMMLDLDDFKHVNDTLGHASGDALLRTIAERLKRSFEGRGQVFRLGGDEFMSIFPLPPDAGGLDRIGEEAISALREPVRLGTDELFVRGSAGMSSFPVDGGDWSALLRCADAAMYAAKASGKNAYAVFKSDMLQRSQLRLTLDNELRHAIERGELRLFYQPVVSLDDGRIMGAEALVRWQHPKRGLVGPIEFIAAAEESGLVIELGQWVLSEAARQVAHWRADGQHDGFYVAVNVSGRQIARGILERQVRQALDDSGAKPSWIEIEITEHSLVEDLQANLDALASLREMGMRMAIDDFGTGLSSLSYLKRLPLNKLKIDRSFVSELPDDRDDMAIATAVISMARALGLMVVAEGVETAEQRDALRVMGCDYAQGYLFSRPIPAPEMEKLLQLQRAAATASVPSAL